jgi:hypothetical protein
LRVERLADVSLGVLVVLSVLEHFALNRFGLFRLGVLVWRVRWHGFPPGELRSSHNYAGDVFFFESKDRWLFQRRDDAWFLPGLVYKGLIERDGDGAVVSVRVPLFPVATFAFASLLFMFRDARNAEPLLLLLAPAVLVLYGRYRGRNAAEAMIPSGHA